MMHALATVAEVLRDWWRRGPPLKLRCGIGLCLMASIEAALGAVNLSFSELADADFQRLGTISGFHQDRDGFIWLAGTQGLARYDGYQLKVIDNSARPGSSQYVFAILPEPQGGLWLATDAGLGFLPTSHDSMIMRRPSQSGFSDVVQAVTPWLDDQLLLGTDRGALIFDRKTARFSAVPNTSGLNIAALAVDSSGNAWLGTRGTGLYQFANLAERPKRYSTSGGLCGDTILTLEMGPADQSLWVGTLGDGVCRFDLNTRTFVSEQLEGTGTVWDVHFDREGGVWLATDRGGLQWRRRSDAQWQVFRPDIHDSDAISSANLRALFEDRQGDLWVSRFPWGIAHHRKRTRSINRFRHHAERPDTLSDNGVLTLHRSAHDQALWVGTEKGLNRVTERGIERMTGPMGELTVLSLADAPAGELWVGTWSQGLKRYTPGGEISAQYPGLSGPGDLSDRFVWALAPGQAGDLWVGTEIGGLNRITAAGVVEQWRQTATNSSLPSNFVRTLITAPNGDWWLGTAAGAVRFDPDSGLIRLMGERHRVRDLLVHGDEIWIATQDAGVQIYSGTGDWRGAITTEHALPSNAVAALARDADGGIWAATSAGLARITAGSVDRVLTRADGLAGDLHHREALLVDDKGWVYAGSIDGLSVFHPDDLAAPAALQMVLTELQVPGRARQPDLSGAKPASLTLAPEENMFSVAFAVLEYAQPAAFEYAYQLTGFDQTWVPAPGRSATFTYLPPGRYQLNLRVRGPGQAWQQQLGALEIEILAPWWRTSWAIAGYLLALLLSVVIAKRLLALHYRWRYLEEAAVTDPLTRIFNRAGIERVFTQLAAEPERTRPVAVVLLDVDNFKRINDRRGHDAGDRVLVGVAKLMQTTLRQKDAVGRWGGEEFIAVCDSVDAAGACRLAERLRAAVAGMPFEAQTDPLLVTVSIGVAELRPGECYTHAIKRADEALYRAKHGGRNCVVKAGGELAASGISAPIRGHHRGATTQP